jgi:hypothetical protein
MGLAGLVFCCSGRWLRQAGHVDTDQRLQELGVELPAPMAPVGNYVAAVVADHLIFVSGTGPVRADGSLVTGKVGKGGLSVETAREAAQLCGLQILAVLRARSRPSLRFPDTDSPRPL